MENFGSYIILIVCFDVSDNGASKENAHNKLILALRKYDCNKVFYEVLEFSYYDIYINQCD